MKTEEPLLSRTSHIYVDCEMVFCFVAIWAELMANHRTNVFWSCFRSISSMAVRDEYL